MGPPRPNRAEHPYQAQAQWGTVRVLIENVKGSLRRGTSPDGREWATEMPAHYGEVPDTVAIDGDPVDVFLGPHGPEAAPMVYVIHQSQKHGPHDDEPKCMVGFTDAVTALATYRLAYDSKRPKNLGLTVWHWADWAEAIQEPRARLDHVQGRGLALSMAEVPEDYKQLEARLRVARTVRNLTKADQLELFKRARVKAHARKTRKGITQVEAHQRTVKRASPSLRALAKLRRALLEEAIPSVKDVARKAGASDAELRGYDGMGLALDALAVHAYQEGKTEGAKRALREHLRAIENDGQATAAAIIRQRTGLTKRRQGTHWREDEGAPKPGEKGHRPRPVIEGAWDDRELDEVADTVTDSALRFVYDPEFAQAMQTPADADELWTRADIPDLLSVPRRGPDGEPLHPEDRIQLALDIAKLVMETDPERASGDFNPPGYDKIRVTGADDPGTDDRHPLAMPKWLMRAIVQDELTGKTRGRLVNVSREVAAAFVERHHSKLPKLNERGIMYALGLMRGDRLVAVATAGTPTGRWDRGDVKPEEVLELTRVASDGTTRNAASQLTARLIKLLPTSGRKLFVTYSFLDEAGATYKALRQLGLRPTEIRRGKTQAEGSARGTSAAEWRERAGKLGDEIAKVTAEIRANMTVGAGAEPGSATRGKVRFETTAAGSERAERVRTAHQADKALIALEARLKQLTGLRETAIAAYQRAESGAARLKVRWEAGPYAAMGKELSDSDLAKRTIHMPTRGHFEIRPGASAEDALELMERARSHDHFQGKGGLIAGLEAHLESLAKASQQGLFAQVKAHLRKTKTGITQVKQHQRKTDPGTPKGHAVPGIEFGPEHSWDLDRPHLTILMMGMGRDSITELLLVKEGKLKSEGRILKPEDIDAVTFIDTGAEWKHTWDQVPKVRALCEEMGIRFLVAHKPPTAQAEAHSERLIGLRTRKKAAMARMKEVQDTDPFTYERLKAEVAALNRDIQTGHPWRKDPPESIEGKAASGYYHNRVGIMEDYAEKGMIVRICDKGSCTANHKLAAARHLLNDLAQERFGVGNRGWSAGVKKGQLGRHRILIGIAADEATRAIDMGRPKYERATYPLVESNVSKFDEQAILERHGFGDVRKSGCFMCKFQPIGWYWVLREKHPKAFQRVVEYEQNAMQAHPRNPKAMLIMYNAGVPITEAVEQWRAKNPEATIAAVMRKDYARPAEIDLSANTDTPLTKAERTRFVVRTEAQPQAAGVFVEVLDPVAIGASDSDIVSGQVWEPGGGWRPATVLARHAVERLLTPEALPHLVLHGGTFSTEAALHKADQLALFDPQALRGKAKRQVKTYVRKGRLVREHLREMPQRRAKPTTARSTDTELLPLGEYESILISFSGGKDSIAATFATLEELDRQGVPHDKVELWHQSIDPPDKPFMDWPVTEDYCRAFAEALGLPIRFQARKGGFEGELTKQDRRTHGVSFDTPDGVLEAGGGGKVASRGRFPQQSANLQTRWCSAVLKIDVFALALRNDPRFKKGGKVLVITGERGEESPGRDKYADLEKHRTASNSRRVDHWRPVLRWTEAAVWLKMAERGIVPHPAYQAGYGRVSCAGCIFSGDREWAILRELLPAQFARIEAREQELIGTIDRAGRTVTERADAGTASIDVAALRQYRTLVQARDVQAPLVDPANWVLPAGAFKHTPGPT